MALPKICFSAVASLYICVLLISPVVIKSHAQNCVTGWTAVSIKSILLSDEVGECAGTEMSCSRLGYMSQCGIKGSPSCT